MQLHTCVVTLSSGPGAPLSAPPHTVLHTLLTVETSGINTCLLFHSVVNATSAAWITMSVHAKRQKGPLLSVCLSLTLLVFYSWKTPWSGTEIQYWSFYTVLPPNIWITQISCSETCEGLFDFIFSILLIKLLYQFWKCRNNTDSFKTALAALTLSAAEKFCLY